jgi:hypothetical protein
MAEINRYFIDDVTDISGDTRSGVAKITLGVSGTGGGPTVQLIMPVGFLRSLFEEVGEKMQKTFGEPRGGQRPGGKGQPPRGNAQFKDLTE